MINISKELTKRYLEIKYDMSTGTDEWQDIKTDFEIESDALGGAMSYIDSGKSLGFDKINKFKSELEKFKIRVDNYQPKDDIEIKEKEILQEKINIGLDIYKQIIDSIK